MLFSTSGTTSFAKESHGNKLECCAGALVVIQPDPDTLFNKILMGFQNFKLFLVNWWIVFKVDFVFEVGGKAEVIFIGTDGFLMFL